MINPNKELFKWGWIDGRIYYAGFWFDACIPTAKVHKMCFPEMLFYFEKDRMIAILENKRLYDEGEKFFRKCMTKNKEESFNKWMEIVKKLEKLYQSLANLSNLSDNEFRRLYKQWHDLHIKFWIWGFVPEFCNWGGERILKNYLQENYPKEFTYLFERLSAPVQMSFYQEEEIDLLKIKRIRDKHLFEKNLAEHQKNYFWIGNSYYGSKILGIGYFRKKLNELSLEEAKNKIKEITNHLENTKKEKEKIIKKYKISDEFAEIAHNLSFSIWWQDFRKKHIFILMHYCTIFLEEIARRKKIKYAYNYVPSEMLDLLEKNKFIRETILKERFNQFLYHYIPLYTIRYINGNKARRIMEPYINQQTHDNVCELKGTVVSRGPTIKAKVRILNSPKDADKLAKGEILIAHMTSPDFIVAIRKASAIITDEGGMTSHAAIVSRELKIPCIVGTKIATKILKDGEIVEIDTNRGLVRRIK